MISLKRRPIKITVRGRCTWEGYRRVEIVASHNFKRTCLKCDNSIKLLQSGNFGDSKTFSDILAHRPTVSATAQKM